MGEKMYALKG